MKEDFAQAVFAAFPNVALRPHDCEWVMEGFRPKITYEGGGLYGAMILRSTVWGTTRKLEWSTLVLAGSCSPRAIGDIIERFIRELKEAPPFYVEGA